MAFHLHRLNLKGQHLRTALADKAYLATALSQARIQVSTEFISALAGNLDVPADAIQRPLAAQEAREWYFYRESTRHQRHVWHQAKSLWVDAGFSQHAIAAVTGISQSHLSLIVNGKKATTLDWQQADRLLQAIQRPRAPETLLPEHAQPIPQKTEPEI